MIKLLAPLGLLGLLSIAVLILIYIIRPNYIQKRVSSTYVWKLSLMYRKKRIPVSKLRNILIIICQVLILASCAMYLAQPNKVLKEPSDTTELIAIIDSSASMLTVSENQTRYVRAVKKVNEDTKEVLSKNGVVSVILADNTPHFLGYSDFKSEYVSETEDTEVARRFTQDKQSKLSDLLNGLINDNMSCSYGVANIDSAIDRCNEVLLVNPDAQITLYTDSDYSDLPKGVNVVNVSKSSEWNAAILNANAESEDNYYAFYVEIACYGRNESVTLNMEVQDANAAVGSVGSTISLEHTTTCNQDKVKTIIFKYFKEGEEVPQLDETLNIEYCPIDETDRIASYQSVHLTISTFEKDSFYEDDNFDIYGGKKPLMKIQYASTLPNIYFTSVLEVLVNAYRNKWTIEFNEVRDGNFAKEGYDYYIFEHEMPEQLPTDGVVLLVDPDKVPSGADFTFGGVRNLGNSLPLTDENTDDTTRHPVMKDVKIEDITVSKYVVLRNYEPFDVLMTCDDNPMLMVSKSENGTKLAVIAFDLHHSNFPARVSFPYMMNNIINYFMPSTVDGNAFEIGEKISLRSRVDELTVKYNDTVVEKYKSFPATFVTKIPGTYVLEQDAYGRDETTEELIYVKIPADESNIKKMEYSMAEPYREGAKDNYFEELLIYFAGALVAILFVEWILHQREEA